MKTYIENIISECLIPDRKGQQQLYEFTYCNLAAAVALYTSDRSEQNWVFNLGMLKIFNSLSRYKKGTNYLGWARTILVRSAIDHIRKNKTYKDYLAPVEVEEDYLTATATNEALENLKNEDLIKVIQSLPENNRMVFTMHEIDGYSHLEIEEITGIKKNTSKWLLAKARKSLRDKAAHFTHLKENEHG